MNWWKPGEPIYRGKTKNQLIRQFHLCHEPFLCKFFYEGKLYACGRSLALHVTGKIDSFQDYIEIVRAEKEDIEEFFDREWCEACNYCLLYSESMKNCIAGEQVKKGENFDLH